MNDDLKPKIEDDFQGFEVYVLTPQLAKHLLETGQMNLSEDEVVDETE